MIHGGLAQQVATYLYGLENILYSCCFEWPLCSKVQTQCLFFSFMKQTDRQN